MNTDKLIIALIELRDSKRDFSGQPIDAEAVKKIIETTDDAGEPPFGSGLEFKFISNSTLSETQRIGTYGMIKGASSFIAGKVRSGKHDLEDFGYAFEKIILKMTDLGLDTCWLGGSFKKEEFTGLMDLKPDEIIPAVTPVGVATGRTTLKEKILRFVIGAKKRKPWNEMFFNGQFNDPLSKKECGEYVVPLEMVRLGPSAGNKQPWRIIKDGGYFHFFIERSPSYQALLKNLGVDLQRIDMGIAMCHFELTCRELKLKGCWKESDTSKITTMTNSEYLVSWET
jgi:hypothetical protein